LARKNKFNMNNIVRNILAVFIGLVIGGLINGWIISISATLIPLPKGVDNSTLEGLQKSIHLFEPKHFVFPFLAHAIGTFLGTLITLFISKSREFYLAILVSGVFLLGGVSMVVQLNAPLWFNALDLVGAYIPMGFGAYLISKKRVNQAN
jgi:hypothetical protein